jgi:hypothetical protein
MSFLKELTNRLPSPTKRDNSVCNKEAIVEKVKVKTMKIPLWRIQWQRRNARSTIERKDCKGRSWRRSVSKERKTDRSIGS